MKKLRKRLAGLKERAAVIRQEVTALYYSYRDTRTGLLPKIIILVTLGYALSPLDLIPDFIPVIGYLDDLVIIPALISLSVKLIPEEVLSEARARAINEPVILKKSRFAAALVIAVWTGLAAVVFVNILQRVFCR